MAVIPSVKLIVLPRSTRFLLILPVILGGLGVSTLVMATAYKSLVNTVLSFVLTGVVIILFISSIIYSVHRLTILRRYRDFKNLLSRIRVEGDKVVFPPGIRASYGVIEAGRYRVGRSTKTILHYDEQGVMGLGEEDLSSLFKPYVYTASIVNKVFRGKKLSFYVRSSAIKVSDEKTSLYLVLLPPSSIGVEKNKLVARHDKDQATASITSSGGSIKIKLTYRKKDSRSARVEFYPGKTGLLVSSMKKVLSEAREPGSIETVWKVPTPKDTVLLPLPSDTRLLNYMYFDHKWIEPIVDNKRLKEYVAGFDDAVLKLVLDFPMSRSIADETRLSSSISTLHSL